MSGSIRIVEMPDIGAFTSDSSVVGEHAGSGRFSAAALLNYRATGGNTSRSALDRAADVINVKDYGAIGDGVTHPLSGVTTFGGVNTTGWSLAQWQTVFPFATALTNELDHLSCMAAIIAAASAKKAVRIPGGIYRAAETIPVTLAVAGPLTVFGDGRGATQCVSYGAFDWFNINVGAGSIQYSSVSFRDLSLDQGNAVTGGQGIVIACSTNLQPSVFITNCDIGNALEGAAPNGTRGAFAIGVNCMVPNYVYVSDCVFYGTLNAGGVQQGIGIRVNGSATYLGFGPKISNCVFGALDKCIQVGDGTNAYVQGLQVTLCEIVFCHYGVHWVAGTGNQNDGIVATGTNWACTVASIYSDGVANHVITGNYFLGNAGAVSIDIQNALGIPKFANISGNHFIGFGQTGAIGVRIGNLNAPTLALISIFANQFAAYPNTNAIVLAAGSKNVSVFGNSFQMGGNVGTDAGTGNVWYNNIYIGDSSILYATGIPAQPVGGLNGRVIWDQVDNTTQYYDPAAFDTNGGMHLTPGLVISGQYGAWSGNNVGKELLIKTTGATNPAIAIADASGGNFIAMVNASGAIVLAGMPPLADTTTPPNIFLSLAATGSIVNTRWTFGARAGFANTVPGMPLNATNDAAAAGLGIAVGDIYRNGSILMVRVA